MGSKGIIWLEITLVLFCLVFKLIMHVSDSHSTSGGQGCLINSIPPALAMCLAQNRCFRKVCSGNKCLRLWIWCQANRIQVLLCQSLAVRLPTSNFSSLGLKYALNNCTEHLLWAGTVPSPKVAELNRVRMVPILTELAF